MHSKNPFKNNYKFKKLVEIFPPLASFVFTNKYGTETIKFENVDAVLALNAALLKLHYHVDWTIPEGNLCPPIPGRLDYLLHASELIPNKKLNLLDIGTGANLIYPILATQHLKWNCTASELDNDSFINAKFLIQQNKSLEKIDLRKQKYKNKIFDSIINEEDEFDLVVCNPPFYKNQHDAANKNRRKAKNLKIKTEKSLNFGGQSHELWYKGGEEAFIKKMVEESVQFKNQVQWFTSLVSNKEHLKNIKRAINKTPATELRIVEMEQGNKKSRFIAWSFKEEKKNALSKELKALNF